MGYMITVMEASVIEKFWAAVEKTNSCWNWVGRLNTRRLPIIRIGGHNGQAYSARIISLKLAGKTVPDGTRTRPGVCRNDLCVNPNHLVMGDAERFWSKVQKLSDPNECWYWTGSLTQDQYGNFKTKNQDVVRAHRFSWELVHGQLTSSKVLVCHKCDNPRCVNPNHLFLGSKKDNAEDMVAKGRSLKHEKNSKAKLTWELVNEIRRDTHISNSEFARRRDMDQSTISNIRSFKIWKPHPIPKPF